MTRILVVDDERGLRVTLSAFLQGVGYVVETAGDVATAIDKLTGGGHYDTVFSDIILPDASGIELLARIREIAPEIQVVMMTGAPTVETAAEALRKGALDYLTKPVSKDAVVQAAQRASQAKELVDTKRRLEETNQRHQQELENRVRERTEQLQDANLNLTSALRELKNAQDQILHQERLNALGILASGIAHDFNNALMPVIGYAELLLSQPHRLDDRDGTLSRLKIILASAQQARETVHRLQELYRKEKQTSLEATNLTALVDEVVEMVNPRRVQAEAEGRHIKVRKNIQGLPMIDAEKSSLRDVLLNLALNAIDAMTNGGTLTFTGQVVGEHILLHVADTGVGMPEDTRSRCFEPFYTTKGKKGSGLGLAIIKDVVQRHGGRVTVESEPDRGTTFSVRLPTGRQTTTTRMLKLPRMPLPPQRILIIDDDKFVRLVLESQLEGDGHKVETAKNGKKGMSMLQSNSFDLVILDRAMPDAWGDEIAMQIKRMRPGMPVIMLTGFGEMMKTQGRPKYIDAILPKPAVLDDLRLAMTKVLAKRSESKDGR